MKDDVAPVDIQFEATDDIEIASIALALDGTKITEFTDFKDYRRAVTTIGTIHWQMERICLP